MAETGMAVQDTIEEHAMNSPVIPLLRPKVRKACSECRRSKSKCEQAEWPCKRCKQRGLDCDLPPIDSRGNGHAPTHSESSARPLYCSVPRSFVTTAWVPVPSSATPNPIPPSPTSPMHSPISPYPQDRVQVFAPNYPQPMVDSASVIYQEPVEYSPQNDAYYASMVDARAISSMPPSPSVSRASQQGPMLQNYVSTGNYRLTSSGYEPYRMSEEESALAGHACGQRYHTAMSTLPPTSSSRNQDTGFTAQGDHPNGASGSGLYYTAQAQPTSGEHWTHGYVNSPDASTGTPTHGYYPHYQNISTPIDNPPARESTCFYQGDRPAVPQAPYPFQGNHRVLEGGCDLQR